MLQVVALCFRADQTLVPQIKELHHVDLTDSQN